MRLTLHVVRTEGLRTREQAVQAATLAFVMAAKAAGMSFKSNAIVAPDPPLLQARLEELQARADYAPSGDPEFDQPAYLYPLSLNELSCLEKHRAAWRTISTSTASDEVHCIIEDDILLMEDFAQQAPSLLRGPLDYELLFLGGDPAPEKGTAPTRRLSSRILTSKEAYLVTPACARALDAGLAQKTKYGARVYLSWALKLHPEWRARCAWPRLTLDGSKVGLFSSATHENNILVFNREFVQLLALLQAPGDLDVVAARPLAAVLSRLQSSPDALHLLGLLQQRLGRHEAANQLYNAALAEMARQGGVLTATSDLMRNAINVHRHLQTDLTEVRALPSKYADAPLL
jgi:hypothetical protein